MPRALLILPTATYRAPEFLEAARRLGVEVVTGSERPQALAELMGDRFIELALADPARAAEQIVELDARNPLDAVLAVDDQGALAAATAAQRLGLIHAAPDAVAATRDKAEMRRRLASGEVPQPRYLVVREQPGEDLEDLVAVAAMAIGYPCVVKPVSLSGSRGVIRVDDEHEARAAARRDASIVRAAGEPSTTLLVEAFVPGDEVALEGLVRDGTLEVLAIFDKPDSLDGPFFEETIYVTPSRHPVSIQEALATVAERAARAIGITEGPVHAELRISREAGPSAERISLIELAARTIGGRCSTALHFARGQSLEELVLAHALGQTTAPAERREGASGVMMLPIPASGRLVRVGGRDAALQVDHVCGLDITIAPGRRVDALPEGDRYLGFLFAEAETPEAVEAALRAGAARLEIEISPRTHAAIGAR